MKKRTKYTFESGTGASKITATVRALTKENAKEKLCQELGVKELPLEWRLVKFDIE